MSVLNKLLKTIKSAFKADKSPPIKMSKQSVKKADKFVTETLAMNNDYRSIKLHSLYQQFGYTRRGSKNTDVINAVLAKNGLHCYPLLTAELKWKENLGIYKFPVQDLGDLFPKEDFLQKFVNDHKSLKQLGMKTFEDFHRPDGSSSILDFLGEDTDGNLAVIELKNKGGDNRGVQQVMRYKTEIQIKNKKRTIRKILITGILDINTAKAILELGPDDLQNFEWYLYKYSEKGQTISFERMTNEFLLECFTYHE